MLPLVNKVLIRSGSEVVKFSKQATRTYKTEINIAVIIRFMYTRSRDNWELFLAWIDFPTKIYFDDKGGGVTCLSTKLNILSINISFSSFLTPRTSGLHGKRDRKLAI